ncbi:hypothetical protein MHB49_14165 [Paenibacillus sp. FSL K6-0108]
MAVEVKFELIQRTIQTYKLKRLVCYLCDVMEVSRSGYYNYFSKQSAQKRVAKAKVDEIVKEINGVSFSWTKERSTQNQNDIRKSVCGHIQLKANSPYYEKIQDHLSHSKGVIQPVEWQKQRKSIAYVQTNYSAILSQAKLERCY